MNTGNMSEVRSRKLEVGSKEEQGKRRKGKVERSEIPNVILCEVNRRVNELTKSISGVKVREKVELV